MGLLDFLQPSEDPNLSKLIDTNHKLMCSHAAMLENYTDQVLDLKNRLNRLEALFNDQTKGKP